MNLLKILKRENPEVDTVVEGTYHDDWRKLHLKLVHLEVPEDVRTVKDGTYIYVLYGITEDFKTVQQRSAETTGEVEVESLAFCKGVINTGGRVLERPRSLVTRDGRVYVDESIRTSQKWYEESLDMIVETAGKIFGDEKYNELYAKAN